MEKKILVTGSDERQKYLAGALLRLGATVCYTQPDDPGFAASVGSCEILAIPVAAKRELTDILAFHIKGGQRVYGSVFPKEFARQCEREGIILVDYMKDDTVAIQNAVATAEGAIAEAIIASKINLHRSRCLLVGFGKCAEILADKLNGLKCDVCVMARSNTALARASAYGYRVNTFEEAKECTDGVDFVFNTVPAPVIGRKILSCLPKHSIVIDIASAPGGVDLAVFSELGIQADRFPGLPARYAPKTSGDILAKAILKWENESFSEKDEKGSLDE